jgi:serine-type D-Ala-D-Ala carboxypeptidase/endopeptidase
LLSLIVTRTAGQSFESLLSERVFTPLGMNRAFVARAPAGSAGAIGHLSTGGEAGFWDFADELAGIGGVRASLTDMTRYARAALGDGPSDVVNLLEAAQRPLPSNHGEPAMGMGWILEPMGEHTVAWHDGGTGGFSSWITVDRAAQRALVLLLDTSWSNVGGVMELARHLWAPEAQPLPPPRTVVEPPAELLATLSGSYVLAGTIALELRERAGALFIRAEDQPEFELGYDSYGDFYVLDFDALLTPAPQGNGSRNFLWIQGGGASLAERVD